MRIRERERERDITHMREGERERERWRERERGLRTREDHDGVSRLMARARLVRGYLAHKKQHPPRTLQ